MKIHPLMMCCLIAGTVAVHAAESDPPLSAQISGGTGMTRAEVKAETLRALAAGEVAFGDVGFPRATASAVLAGRSRAEVKAETRQALAAGEITFGDAPYPQASPPRDTGLTRAAVRGELLRAIAAHEFHFSDTAYPESGIVTTPRTKARSKAVVVSPAATASATPAS